MVEPGSTFKIVVIAAALEQKAVTPESMFHCENGSFAYAGRILRDVHGYGSMSVHDIMVKSSNIGCAKIALHLGADTFYEYIRRFGFGERTGLGLPGEIPGLVRPRHSWTGLSITRVPMGHEIAVTPLQLAMAMSVIANGGNMMLPQIVRSVQDDEGREVVAFSPKSSAALSRKIPRPKWAHPWSRWSVSAAPRVLLPFRVSRWPARPARRSGWIRGADTLRANMWSPLPVIFRPTILKWRASSWSMTPARPGTQLRRHGGRADLRAHRRGHGPPPELVPESPTPGATIALVPFGNDMN